VGEAFSVRCTEEEKARWQAAATAAHRTLSDHVRCLLDQEALPLSAGEELVLAETRRLGELLVRLWGAGSEETVTKTLVNQLRVETDGIPMQVLVGGAMLNGGKKRKSA